MLPIKLKTLALLLFVLPACLAHGQSKDTIYWNADRKITWENFKGRPDKTTNLLAMTQAGIGYNVACTNGDLYLKIYCYFNVNKSWTKETGSQELLQHEQLHFDITELYARILRKKLSELSDPCGKNIRELDKIYQSNFNECAKTQDLYDKETNHSINNEKQKEWEQRIAKELKALEKFSGVNH